jgi:regulatory protein
VRKVGRQRRRAKPVSAPQPWEEDERERALDRALEVEREDALDRAVRALARRDHSAESLRAKLERAGVSESARDAAVETLAGVGYLDDERFARGRAEGLAARGYGDDWIRADLDAQGVVSDVAETALAGLEPERERALREARKLEGGPRAACALQRRGFSEEALEGVLAGPVADDP